MIVPGKDGQTQQTIDMSQTTPIKCEKCDNVVQVDLNLEEVKVHKKKNHSTKIMLDDVVGVKMLSLIHI